MDRRKEEDDEVLPSLTPSQYVGSHVSDQNQFSVVSLNVQSMNNKFDAIRTLAYSTGATILACQEIWGHNPTTDYSIKGFHKPVIKAREGNGMNLGGGWPYGSAQH